METKKIKVIDEHGIDREANIICKFTTDSIDYILYSIERDDENDNLFASRLINNNDSTSSMVNIEDSSEKSRITDIIKEMITYSINSGEGTVNHKISLPNGKNVEISGVLINKDQNINVAKTYVTTVKKAVTKVSADFYKVDSIRQQSTTSQIFEPVKDDIFVPPVMASGPVVEPSNVLEENAQSVIPELPNVEPTIPTLPEINGDNSNLNLEAPKVENVETPIDFVPEINPVANLTSDSPVQNLGAGISKDESIPEPVSVLVTELSASSQPVVANKVLSFDASAESNFIRAQDVAPSALDNGTLDGIIPTESEGVQALRQFGSDEPVVAPQQTLPVQDHGKALTRSNGFANNKFLTVIAIAFFIAACVFLGYEAFQYFQIVR